MLCNPPFNQRDWGADELAYDERWAYGVPPRSESELAWVQHCLAHTRPGCRIVVLMPSAAASRLSGRRIRRELLRRGVLSAVIGLPVGAAVPLHVGLHLWVMERPDTKATQQQQVLFIDAENNRTEGEERRTTAWEELRARVVQTWRTFLEATGEPDGAVDAPRFSRAVPVVELLDESVDLTPQRHLPVAAPRVSSKKAHEWAGTMRRRLLRTLKDTRSSVPGHGWKVRDLGEWRMTTVDDLARSGALVLHRAPSAPVVEPDEGTGPGY